MSVTPFKAREWKPAILFPQCESNALLKGISAAFKKNKLFPF